MTPVRTLIAFSAAAVLLLSIPSTADAQVRSRVPPSGGGGRVAPAGSPSAQHAVPRTGPAPGPYHGGPYYGHGYPYGPYRYPYYYAPYRYPYYGYGYPYYGYGYPYYGGAHFSIGIGIGVGCCGYGYGAYGYPYGPYAYGYGFPYAYYGAYAPVAPYGGVRIQVAQRDAEVYADGYFAGVVDNFDGSLQSLNLEPGAHRIEVRAPGFESASFEVYAQPGRTITYRTNLRPSNQQ